MIKYLVKGQNIETLEHEVIADNQISFVNIHFVFDNNWKPLHKVVQFAQDEFVYNRVLGYDGNVCKLPSEIHAGVVKMSLFGYDTETVRATTIIKNLHVRPSGFEEINSQVPPTPDLYQQLLSEIKQGNNGKSAYEIATENGFIGSEIEWLESLKGSDGKNGVNGKDGINGKSAYEIALKNGFTGSEAEWLESLKGSNGKNGVNGKDGINGKSAYEIATENGFTGSEAEWLESLKCSIDTSIYPTKDDIESEIQQLRDSIQFDLQTKSEEILYLQNKITILESEISNEYVVLFNASDDVFEKYDTNICLMHNNGTYSLIKFTEQYPEFCIGDQVLNYSTEALGWGAEVSTTICTPVNLDSNSKILMEYCSGATQQGTMYLVKNVGRDSHTPIADFIFNKIKSNDCILLNFNWLYSENYITTLTSCSNVPTGEYYLAWVGVSDNTHPKIKAVKILRG